VQHNNQLQTEGKTASDPPVTVTRTNASEKDDAGKGTGDGEEAAAAAAAEEPRQRLEGRVDEKVVVPVRRVVDDHVDDHGFIVRLLPFRIGRCLDDAGGGGGGGGGGGVFAVHRCE